MKIINLRHEFVEFIPQVVPDGIIYVSIPYATAVHNCCCGCGKKVVTPLSPRDWKLIFDGETVSLDPSIGNWSFPCQSHYWIWENKVHVAEKWTDEKIQAGRLHDTRKKAAYYGLGNSTSPPQSLSSPPFPKPKSSS